MSMYEGFLLINKPKDLTSYDCVEHIKKLVGKKVKIGHAGTLDPFATGLLIVAVGRAATRHIEAFMTLPKEYVAQGKLGELTDTLDSTGTVLQTDDVGVISSEQLRDAIQSLQPSYMQKPPIYSALKYKGERLYALARKGILSRQELDNIAQEKAREVFLYEIALLTFDQPYFTIKARVSHGTYIRSLINDIAQQAGSCATTYALERTAIGPITVGHAIDLAIFKTDDDVQKHMLSLSQVRERFSIGL